MRFAPAATGSGASVFEMPRTGAEATVVLASGPVWARDWLLTTVQPVLVITMPLASGESTRTVRVTEPETPALTLPMFQVTTPPATPPDAEADTNVVLAGSGSRRITPVAFEVPVFWYDRV